MEQGSLPEGSLSHFKDRSFFGPKFLLLPAQGSRLAGFFDSFGPPHLIYIYVAMLRPFIKISFTLSAAAASPGPAQMSIDPAADIAPLWFSTCTRPALLILQCNKWPNFGRIPAFRGKLKTFVSIFRKRRMRLI